MIKILENTLYLGKAKPSSSGGGGGGTSGADVTYDAEEEQLVITTENTPSIVDLDNLTLGDRLNNVATFVTYFTDSQNNKLAVFVLDAIYRKLSGTSFSTSDTSLIKAYGSAQLALASKDSATYTTDKVFAGVTPSASSYSSFYYARNPSGTEFTTTVNGKVYKSQLPNLYELNEIYTNKTALNAVDPTNTESTNLADWNFDGSATSNAIGYGGGVWAIKKNEGIGNRGGDKGVIPVLEIPVVTPNINTIKLDNNVLDVKGNAYTRTNLIAGSGLKIEEYVPPYAIDSNTLCLFHYDDSYADAISGNEPGGYYDGWYSYSTGKFDKSIIVSNTSDSYGTGMFEISTSQDYCFDFWCQFTNDTSFVFFGPIKFVRNSEYVLEVFHNSTSLGTFTMTESLGAFNHYAFQRKNANYDIFFNGKKLSIATTTDSWGKGAPYGFSSNSGDPAIDELRISGVARYSGDFTPNDRPYQEVTPSAEKVWVISLA